jgi:HAD superfamily hydrolase (TIGR01509 family)
MFDCDGVLVDSEILACASLAELMTLLGHAMTTEDAVRTFAGRSRKDVIARAEQLLTRPIPDEMGAEAATRLLARFRRELKPVEGVVEAIAALPFRRCVASSSSPDRLALSLEVTGLTDLFYPYIFSAEQVARGKPAPDLFLFAARSVGADPSHCIVIEDSPLGIEAARAAGMSAIGFSGASHATGDLAERLATAGAHIVVRAMRDLPDAVTRLAAGAMSSFRGTDDLPARRRRGGEVR